ncbi:uracil-DNA glycosylase [Flagellatimonas centrodinii]|uniref:uracil-DNA glycosylase n=1 Tax=Flagellatimonas centrodinii TaxID=2806210 RepID=UPI001FEDA30B|nr:uracil-DNA glycosylase [Flagellatimonas centrodinii]ULQ46098.1 uracil-DNA glycosylase [Flagellatimonas centrodinii]
MTGSSRDTLKRLGIETWTLRTPRGAGSVDSTAAAVPSPARAADTAVVSTMPVSADRTPTAPATRPSPPERRAEDALPADWEGLQAAVAGCTRCSLCETRTQTVFGVGGRSAPLMVVGEGPGADEDAQGEPFVGRAGKLLDQMLAAIGHSRQDNVFIANVVKCRPPGNRDPAPSEAEACRAYLEQQIALVRPKLIVALGRVAAQRLLATDEALARLRGPLHHYGPLQIPLMITYHPAYLLRSPREKAKSWEDLKKVHRFLNGIA